MSKPVFAMLLGGILGVFDGLTALVTGGPEIPAQIWGIVAGSTFKGVAAGLIIGLIVGFATAKYRGGVRSATA